jgi:hypothetical protein
VTVVAAIGNNGVEGVCNPASYKDVVCVSGLMSNNTKAPFSNWDTRADVGAPAAGIVSQDWTGLVAIWSGTSCAAPIVAGTVAEGMRLCEDTPSPTKIRKTLKQVGYDLNDLNLSDYKGKLGRGLNFSAFVQKLIQKD